MINEDTTTTYRQTDYRRIPAEAGGRALLAGATGALAKAAYLMAVSGAMGMGAFFVPNLAGIGGPDVVYGLDGYMHAATTLSGVLMHLATGAFWGIMLYAAISYFMPRALATNGRTAVTGLVFGVVAYAIASIFGPATNYFTPLVNWLGAIHPFVGHLIYGLVTAYALRAWATIPTVSVMFAPEVTTSRDYTTTNSRSDFMDR